MVLGLCAIALGATAARGAEPPKGRPCQPDIQKLCKDVKVGQGRIRDCLAGHAAELSPGCKKMLDSKEGIFAAEGKSGGGRHQGVLEACKTDLDKHCKGIEPGGGRLRDCLEKHKSEISDACKKAFSSFPPAAAKASAAKTPAKTPAKTK
jgi:Golgi apparatus protein 1